eukprot:754323-Hanusia_phi.AAC.2
MDVSRSARASQEAFVWQYMIPVHAYGSPAASRSAPATRLQHSPTKLAMSSKTSSSSPIKSLYLT